MEVSGPCSIPMLVLLQQEPSWNLTHHLREEEASELSGGLTDIRQVLEFFTTHENLSWLYLSSKTYYNSCVL